jgi:hypothetical protein
MQFVRSVWTAAIFFVAVAGSPVLAADWFPADFRGEPGSIYALWNFNTPANPSPYDELNIVPLEDFPLFPIIPTADVTNMAWWGAADFAGWISLTEGSILNFNMPNFIDFEPLKKLWIQITYLPLFDPEDYPFVAAIEANDNEIGFVLGELVGSYTIPQLGYRVESWEITPNPDFELVQIYIPQWVLVDQVIIDTQSVPELSSAMLFSAASVVLVAGVYRRRLGRQAA